MLQSRRSLSNPTPPSPKLSSDNGQHYYNDHQHRHQKDAPLATSSNHLSILPPLSRAQSLLLQMASLTTKLFEVSPNCSSWRASFRGSLPTFLSSQTPPPLDSTLSSPEQVLSLFTSFQTQLLEAVTELQEILDIQDAKEKIAREIQTKDSVLLDFASKLKEAEHVLDVLVDDYSHYRRSKKQKCDVENPKDSSIGTPLKLSDIVSYAHRISYTTFAPPEFGAGTAPLRGALPPAPQEEQMRASQLYAFADLDVGLPKIVETEEWNSDSLVETLDFAATQELIPPQFTVPPGMQPGMPVELPTDLPMPPHGWKPGDPIELSLIGSFAPKAEELPRPAPHVTFKAPEPIHVPFVQLDFNHDEDEDSTEDSSDVGSPEDDDEVCTRM